MIPHFKQFLSFRLFTTIGMQMKMTIMGYFLYEMSHETLTLGLLGLYEAIPRIAMSLPAGYIVERMEKRKALFFVIISYFFLSTLLLATMYILKNDINAIKTSVFIIVFLMGIVGSLAPAASTTLFSHIIPKEHIARYSAMSSNAWQIGAVLGPILAGFLIFQIGTMGSMFFVLLCLIISIISVLYLPKLESQSNHPFNFNHSIVQIKEGLDFVFNNKILLWAISLDLFAVLFGGAVALLPAFAKDILMVDGQGFGFLRAAMPLGSALAMIYLSFRPIQKNTGKWLLVCIGFFGVFTIFFALSRNLYLSLFCLMMTGAFDAVSVVIRSTLLLLETPDAIRARVSSVNSMFISSSNEIGAFESGFAAHYMGTVRSVVFGGSMTIFFVIIAFLKAKELKKFELHTSKT